MSQNQKFKDLCIKNSLIAGFTLIFSPIQSNQGKTCVPKEDCYDCYVMVALILLHQHKKTNDKSIKKLFQTDLQSKSSFAQLLDFIVF